MICGVGIAIVTMILEKIIIFKVLKTMEILDIPIPGLFLIKNDTFRDERGCFTENWNQKKFSDLIHSEINFVQDNQSISKKNVLRGFHFQKPPFAQGKLVRVIKGSVLDVAIDIRKGSQDYGKHYKVVLSGDNDEMLYVSPGFAHGFLSLSENTIFSYKCTNFYNPKHEQTLIWNDEDLGINWKIGLQINDSEIIVSDKDMKGVKFKDFKSPFEF